MPRVRARRVHRHSRHSPRGHQRDPHLQRDEPLDTHGQRAGRPAYVHLNASRANDHELDLGVVGVAVVGTSLDRLVDTPARWGTHGTSPSFQIEGEGVLDNRDIGAAAVGRFDEQVKLDGHETIAMTLDPVKGDFMP